MIPNVSNALSEWEQSLKLKVICKKSVDFKDITDVKTTRIRAVVQPANKSDLKIDSLNWSKRYILIHKRGEPLAINNIVEWKCHDYKIISSTDYVEYGYSEFIGEETKNKTLAATS